MATLVNKQKIMFNPEQTTVFDTVLESVTNNQDYLFLFILLVVLEKLFFVILLLLRLNEERIFHSCFKISLSINKNSIAELK